MGLTLTLAIPAGIDIRESGGLELVPFAEASSFLDACAAAGMLVLGIEGFNFDGGEVRPDMNAIADFSQLTDSEGSVLEARSFIEAVGRQEMLFDFALAEGPRDGLHKGLRRVE